METKWHQILLIILCSISFIQAQTPELKGLNFYSVYYKYFSGHLGIEPLRLNYNQRIDSGEYNKVLREIKNWENVNAVEIIFTAKSAILNIQDLFGGQPVYQDSILAKLKHIRFVSLQIGKDSLKKQDKAYSTQFSLFLEKLSDFQELDFLLIFTSIDRLPKEISNLKSLRILETHGVTEFPNEIQNVKLEHLSLNANKENESISLNSFYKAKNIRILYLRGLRIDSLKYAASNFKNLYAASFHFDHMDSLENATFPSWVATSFKKLVELTVENPSINALSENFGTLDSLKFLGIHAPLIRLRSDQLPVGLLNLQLDWKGNPTELSKALSNLYNLQKLSLAVYTPKSIPVLKGKYPNLEKVFINVKGKKSTLFISTPDESKPFTDSLYRPKIRRKLRLLKKRYPNTKFLIDIWKGNSLIEQGKYSN